MSKIVNIHARQILDSRGNPTVEAEVFTDKGIMGRAAVPSGASTGKHEAVELRDGDKNSYLGKGVLNAVNNIKTEIQNSIVGCEVSEQSFIDNKMIDLDGTSNKANLGTNAILAVSMATCKVAAISKKISLFKYLSSAVDKAIQ